jgi:hypothetical protein
VSRKGVTSRVEELYCILLCSVLTIVKRTRRQCVLFDSQCISKKHNRQTVIQSEVFKSFRRALLMSKGSLDQLVKCLVIRVRGSRRESKL